MKRHLLGLALGALVSFVLGGNAQACHGKKVCAAPAPTCAPAPVVCEPAPVCAPAPVVETCAPKKSCFKLPTLPKLHCSLPKPSFHMPKFKGLGCKTAAPACTETVAYEAAPVYAAPQQVYAAPQQVLSAPQALAAPQN